MTVTCRLCAEPKSADAYYFGRRTCIECVREAERRRYWRNVERRRSVAREWWHRVGKLAQTEGSR